jgi:hypothetical protein
MGNTSEKERQDIDRVNKPKRRRTRPVGKGNADDNRSVPQLSNAASDTHQQKDPLRTHQTSSKPDFRETVNSTSSPTLQLPVSKPGPRKFAPSFLATSTGLDRESAVVSNVIVEPGKRWYDHNYESKVEPFVVKYS